MISTLRTLLDGVNARAEERLKDTYAVELIDQRIREAENNLSAAKMTLASLIQRKRGEKRMLDTLETRSATLTSRVCEALAAKRDGLARDGAEAIAQMENERSLRTGTLERLDTRIAQLQASVEAAHRRIVDLKQGAITARAVRREQAIQSKLNKTTAGTSAADEAEALIKRVVNTDDPFEQGQILRDIDRSLVGEHADDKLSDAGFGTSNKVTAQAVLDRLSHES